MGKAIGIDLGTTNTAVAVLVDGRPRVLEDERGYKVLPSCVSRKQDGEFLVGQAARNLAITQPDRTVQAVKRLAGRRFDSAEAAQIRGRVSYGVGPDDDGGCLVQIDEDWYTPTEVQAVILQAAKAIAERALDETVDEAVITVPAYFNHQQRSATLEAARIAGLRCERLLNEPTAAALAYGHRKDIDRTIVVYDLGGGTFDVSVLHLSRGVYEVLSTAGETYLGGEDFDYRLVDYLADNFGNEHGVDLRDEPQPLQRLKEAAERAKCELSFTDRTTVLVPRITPTASLEVAISRQTLEGLVDDLVDRTLDIARKAVTDAGLQLADVDDVILVGGQTRMPRVREAISALFQVEPSRSVHPEEVVAIGAAVHASSLTDADANRPLLLDVTPFDLGIDVAGGLFQALIKRNSHVPAAGSQVFATARDNQRRVEVTVRQGDSQVAAENEFLGQFVMGGLTAAPRMETKVEVTFRLDSNGMLHVSAVEQGTGERKEIVIRNYAEVSQGGEAQVEGQLDDDFDDENTQPLAVTAQAEKKGFFSRLFGRSSEKGEQPPHARKRARQAREAEAANTAAEQVEPLETLDAAQLEPVDELRPDDVSSATEQGDSSAAEATPVVAAEVMPAGDEEPEALDAEALLLLPDEAVAEESSTLGLGVDEEEDDGAFGFVAIGDAASDQDEATVDPFASEDDPFAADDDPFSMAEGTTWNDDGDDDSRVTDPGVETVPSLLDDPAAVETLIPASEAATRETAPVGLPEALPEPAPRSAGSAPTIPEATPEEDDVDLPTAETAHPRAALAAQPIQDGGLDPAATAPMLLRRTERRRRPAKLKLSYPDPVKMAEEYAENLSKGGSFVKTTKPLEVGRECTIEVRAPGLDEPIRISGVVSWSSLGVDEQPDGQSEGMGIAYQLDDEESSEIAARLDAILSGTA